MSSRRHSIQITTDNPDLGCLRKTWVTAEFTAEDGIGPMSSLHEAGDSIVAIATLLDEGTKVVGSGVMIAPGLILAATHVLEDFPKASKGPACITFLPDGARVWLPRGRTTATGPSRFDSDRRRVSDLTLMSCSLNSAAREDFPLTLAPIKIALPLEGERLWAFGYRHGEIIDGASALRPLVTSGLTTACFPHGRGERMPSPCIEVAMETVGGMSGGPVVDGDGWLVGIISSSLAGGPTYVTLVWDAFRLSVSGAPASVWPHDEADLFTGKDLGLLKVSGDVTRTDDGDVVWHVPTAGIISEVQSSAKE